MPCLFESERVSVSVWDISLLRQNCRAEFCSPHENMPCWFHLISDHRLCSPVIIRKYLFQTFCASNIILWLKETIPAMSKQQRWKKCHFWKMYSSVHSQWRLVLFFFFFSMSTQISLTSACQQPNHQITYMQHIWNQMRASYHNNSNKTKLSTGRGP